MGEYGAFHLSPTCEHQNVGLLMSLNQKESPQLFSEVLKNIDSGVIILNIAESSVLFMNRHAARLIERLGLDADYDSLCAHLFQGEDFSDAAKVVLARKRTVCYERRILGYSLYPLEGLQKQFVAVFLQDITDQKRLDSIAAEVELSKNIGFIFSGIRHEIANPVNSIKMALSVMESCDESGSEKMSRYIQRMQEDIDRLERLLHTFKNFNLYEAPVPQTINLAEFLRQLVGLVHNEFRREGICLLWEASEDVDVFIDPRALQQVALNLLANARDAVQNGEKPTITLRCEEGETTVHLKVIDNGCGIDPEQRRHLFKPFHTSKEHGTGLGLVLAKKMLAQMNCVIEVESEKGKGTTVVLVLPKGH